MAVNSTQIAEMDGTAMPVIVNLSSAPCQADLECPVAMHCSVDGHCLAHKWDIAFNG